MVLQRAMQFPNPATYRVVGVTVDTAQPVIT
jgi:hypothetical protein